MAEPIVIRYLWVFMSWLVLHSFCTNTADSILYCATSCTYRSYMFSTGRSPRNTFQPPGDANEDVAFLRLKSKREITRLHFIMYFSSLSLECWPNMDEKLFSVSFPPHSVNVPVMSMNGCNFASLSWNGWSLSLWPRNPRFATQEYRLQSPFITLTAVFTENWKLRG